MSDDFKKAVEEVNLLATQIRMANSKSGGCDSLSIERRRMAYNIATQFKKIAMKVLYPESPKEGQ